MRRPKLFIPKRAYGGNTAKARTKKDAAVQLVVLEFGVSRLERELKHMQEKTAACTAELRQKNALRQKLLEKLSV